MINGLTSIQDLAVIRFEQPDNVFEQNTFARTAKADDGGNFTLINLKINGIKIRAVTEALGDPFKFE